jgi:DNA-binding transcriptional ArsR family regulator
LEDWHFEPPASVLTNQPKSNYLLANVTIFEGEDLRQVLWYILAGTRGGYNRIRIIDTIKERPYNANQLADVLEMDYRTIRHHLKVLTENNILARPTGDSYGSMYFLSGIMEKHLGTFEEIKKNVKK